MTVRILHGDCLDLLPTLDDASVDAVVCDPPYGLEFMGRDWDGADGFRRSLNLADVGRDSVFGRASRTSPEYRAGHLFQQWCERWATECLRVLKPGGHLLAFGGTRTFHRLACAIEDAGFEIRDSIAWLYGSGFPKSLDVSKAIDKRRDWTALPLLQVKIREARTARGISQSEAARRIGLIGPGESLGGGGFMWFETGMRVPTREQYPRLKAALSLDDECDQAFEEAEREVLRETTTNRDGGSWAEQVKSGMFQTGERTVRETAPATDDARTWQGWGTALKPAFEPVVVARKPLVGNVAANVLRHGTGAINIDAGRIGTGENKTPAPTRRGASTPWFTTADATNLGGNNTAGRWPPNVCLDESQAAVLDQMSGTLTSGAMRAVTRSSAPMFNVGKDLTFETDGDSGGASRFFYVAKADSAERPRVNGVAHPTVKPLTLMRWLVRLVTPPGGTCLDPFAGSGTTGEACQLEGLNCILMEREAEYIPLIEQRLAQGVLDFGEGIA